MIPFSNDLFAHSQTENATPLTLLPAPPVAPAASQGPFEPYLPKRFLIEGAQRHPAPLVESRALAGIKPPWPKAVPNIPRELIERGSLSEAQLEAIALAWAAHDTTLRLEAERTVRGGFILQDGTGVGKSRVPLALHIANAVQERTHTLWLTENDRIFAEIVAEGGELDIPPSRFFDARGHDAFPQEDGIAMFTYASLREAVRVDKEHFWFAGVDRIVQWLTGCAQPLIVVDESHNARNSVGTEKEVDFWSDGRSIQARALLILQELVPNARVIYLSATPATSAQTFAYAERLGLWGPDTAFKDRDAFLKTIEDAGTIGLEILARDLKSSGRMLARTLSFDGVEYETLRVKLTDDQITRVQTVQKVLRLLRNELDATIKIVAPKPKDDGTKKKATQTKGKTKSQRQLGGAIGVRSVRGAFETTIVRVFGSLFSSLAVPAIVEDVRAEIERDHSCVIQYSYTDEAFADRALATHADKRVEDIDLSIRGALYDFVQGHFPLYMENDKGEKILDKKKNPIVSEVAIAARARVLEAIAGLETSAVSPIDAIRHGIGASTVAEVSGRSRSIDRTASGALAIVNRPPNINRAEIDAFQAGKKRVLVFTASAGGTGVSYHADRNRSDGRRRVQYVAEIPWRADVALQALGRTHRTNQTVPPLVKIVQLELPAAVRWFATLYQRLEAVGAIAQGQRDATMARQDDPLFDANDNLLDEYGTKALEALYDAIREGRGPVDAKTFQDQTQINLDEKGHNKDVHRFFNRLLTVDVDIDGGLQGALVTAFRNKRKEFLAMAQRDKSQPGLVVLNAKAIRVESREVLTTSAHGAETERLVLACDHVRKKTPLEAILLRLEAAQKHPQARLAGFYLRGSDVIAVIPSSYDERDRAWFLYFRPDFERPHLLSDMELRKYQRISSEVGTACWKEAFDKIPEVETSHLTLITGALLAVWNKLPGTKHTAYLAVTDEGERILGVQVSEALTLFPVLGAAA